MKRLVLPLLALLAACSASPENRVGIVTPPERTVNYDPSTVDGGLAAVVGFSVNSPLGDKSWMKYGTGNSQWQLNPVGPQTIQSWLTSTIDFTASTASYSFNAPQIASKKFFVTGYSVVFLTRDAVLTTALVVRLSQNGVNLMPGGNLTVNLATTNLQSPPATFNPATTPSTPPDMTTFPLQVTVVTPVAGSGLTTCTGYFQISGYYM